MQNKMVNWVKSNQNSLHTLFPFGNNLYCFSIYNPKENCWQLKSLKIRNADYIYANRGCFDTYFLSPEKIIEILSEIDYLDSQVLALETNSLKSVKRFVNKRISQFLKTAPSVPIPVEERIAYEEMSGEDLIAQSASASTLLDSIRKEY